MLSKLFPKRRPTQDEKLALIEEVMTEIDQKQVQGAKLLEFGRQLVEEIEQLKKRGVIK